MTNEGVRLSHEGRREEALAHFRQALAMAPDIPEIHANLGTEYLYRGQLTEAAQAYQTALRLNVFNFSHPEFHGFT